MPEPSYRECFQDLQSLQKYAKSTNENTPMENNDTLRPDFTKYYQSLKPSFFQKIQNKVIWILSKIKLVKTPAWNVSAFKALIEDLGSSRQMSGMKDNFVHRIQTQPNSKIVVFGNLQGSFHSFVRCLAKLKELEIIDNSLKITQAQNYIFLMGDVVDRSPFTLETLSAAMRLIQVNPNNCIYLRGNHEDNNYWQEHTLKTELQIRAAHLSNGAIPFEKEVNAFFNSLPIAAYLTDPSTPNNFVRLSDAGRQNSTILNELNFADILTKTTLNNFTYFSVKEGGMPSTTQINIKAIIRGEKKRKTFQKNDGLRLLAPDLDSVAWNVISCPNVVYQKALEFFDDAFAIITTAENLNDWAITLYNRDIRTNDPFKETKYNLISGLDSEAQKKIGLEHKQAQPAQTNLPNPPQQFPAQVPQTAQEKHPTQAVQTAPSQTPHQVKPLLEVIPEPEQEQNNNSLETQTIAPENKKIATQDNSQ